MSTDTTALDERLSSIDSGSSSASGSSSGLPLSTTSDRVSRADLKRNHSFQLRSTMTQSST